MGSPGSRPLGSICPPGGIQPGVQFISQTFERALVPSKQQTSSGGLRDRGHDSKKGSGTCSQPQYTGVLQSDFCSPQENRGVQTSNRPKTSEPIFGEKAFQNGNWSIHKKGNAERNVGLFYRPKRRILSHSYSSKVKEVPSDHSSRSSVSVQSTTFRGQLGPMAFHQSIQPASCNAQIQKDIHTSVSGRLASQIPVQKSTVESKVVHHQTDSNYRMLDKLGKVRTRTDSRDRVCRSQIRSQRRHGLSSLGEDGQTQGRHSSFSGAEQGRSCQVAESVRPLNQSPKHGSFRPTPCQTDPVQPAFLLVPSERISGDASPSLGFSSPEHLLVARPIKFLQGRSITSSGTPNYGVYRCFYRGLGSPFRGQKVVRKMDRDRQKVSYKCSGDESCHQSSRTSGSASELLHSDKLRQYNSNSLHQQSGRNKVLLSDARDSSVVSVSPVKRLVPESQVSTRSQECSGRLSVQKRSDPTSRMGLASSCGQGNISDLGDSFDRPVCDLSEQPATGVCVTDIRSESQMQ